MCPRDAGHETRPLQTIVVPHIGGADPGQGPLDGTEVFVRGVRLLRNVWRPTLTVFQPGGSAATGAALLICPGGGFQVLAIDHEGLDVARWATERGLVAFVLRYRLLSTPETDGELESRWGRPAPEADRSRQVARMGEQEPLSAADGRAALRTIRDRAAEWGVSPTRVAAAGFSAGARVVALCGAGSDRAGRPDAVAAIYCPPWPIEVSPDPPPLFAAAAADDPVVPDGTQGLAAAWRGAGGAVDLHLYAEGGHGFGMRRQGKDSDRWAVDFEAWLRGLGMLAEARPDPART